jgi:hypothetical protein
MTNVIDTLHTSGMDTYFLGMDLLASQLFSCNARIMNSIKDPVKTDSHYPVCGVKHAITTRIDYEQAARDLRQR